MKQYVFVWDFMGAPITANLTLDTIAWLVGSRGIRNVHVWEFEQASFPVERRLLINPAVHCVALQNRESGEIIDCSTYPVAACS